MRTLKSLRTRAKFIRTRKESVSTPIEGRCLIKLLTECVVNTTMFMVTIMVVTTTNRRLDRFIVATIELRSKTTLSSTTRMTVLRNDEMCAPSFLLLFLTDLRTLPSVP